MAAREGINTFPVKIVTPEKPIYQGNATSLILRTISGDIAVLPGHIDYAAPLGTGDLVLSNEKGGFRGACSGGVITVLRGKVTVVAERFSRSDNKNSK